MALEGVYLSASTIEVDGSPVTNARPAERWVGIEQEKGDDGDQDQG